MDEPNEARKDLDAYLTQCERVFVTVADAAVAKMLSLITSVGRKLVSALRKPVSPPDMTKVLCPDKIHLSEPPASLAG